MTEKHTMTAAQAIVQCIKSEEIKKVFCVPGESYLPLLDAFYDEKEIDVYSTRHESGAAFMAEAYAKATYKPGVVMATRAVGASNLAIGVHTAYQDSTPMVVLLGQVSSKFRGREGFQEVDLDRYFQPIAKWTVEITDPLRVPELINRALYIAKSGRPGPVVVALPEDILPMEGNMQFPTIPTKPHPAPSTKEVQHLLEVLVQAKRPLIIAGGGVKQSQAEDLLVQFASKTNIPVIASFRRHDVFPNNHPLYVGHLGLGPAKEIVKTVQEADVICAIGTRLSEVTTQDYSLISSKQKLIHLDIDTGTIGKAYMPDVAIVADAKEALQQLLVQKMETKASHWAMERRKAYEEASLLKVSNTDSINKHVMKILIEKLESDTVITNDAGNFAAWLHAYYPFTERQTYIGPTSGAMGYGMPAAIGAKLAFPYRTVVSLSGDGGFLMTANEIETAVRYQIPVICLVFNNKMYGTIRMHQEMHYPKKVIATDLGDVSFKKLAISMGADGYVVSDPKSFHTALEQALSRKKVAVIEIVTNREQISVSSTIEQIRNRK